MARVLFVSKPVVPPWNDSSKNLARDVAGGLARHEPVVWGDGSDAWSPARGVVEPVYRGRGAFAPGVTAQLRVLRRLAVGGRADLWHFFFAPNPRSSTAGRLLAGMRRVPTVQTVCSRPRVLEDATKLLFANRTIVLSEATECALLQAGVSRARLTRIAPAVPPLEPLSPVLRREAREHFGIAEDEPTVVYPGDLELGDGAPRIMEAVARMRGVTLVMACRAKTAGARDAEARLRLSARELELEPRVRWVGETPSIHRLLGAADVVALPTTDLYAKMDLPLVLLEAMWLARPVVVVKGSPAAELVPGVRVAPTDPEGLAEALRTELAGTELGARGREVAEQRYHPDAMVAAYEKVYDEVLGES